MSKTYQIIIIDSKSRVPLKNYPTVTIDSDTMGELIAFLESEPHPASPLHGLAEELETLTKICTLPEEIQSEICDLLIRGSLGNAPQSSARIARLQEKYGHEEVDNFIEEVETSSNRWESSFDEFIENQVSKTLNNLK